MSFSLHVYVSAADYAYMKEFNLKSGEIIKDYLQAHRNMHLNTESEQRQMIDKLKKAKEAMQEQIDELNKQLAEVQNVAVASE